METIKFPKWLDEWVKKQRGVGVTEGAIIFMLARQGMGYSFDDGESLEHGNFIYLNKLEIINGIINGYEVDEPKYILKQYVEREESHHYLGSRYPDSPLHLIWFDNEAQAVQFNKTQAEALRDYLKFSYNNVTIEEVQGGSLQ